jgi:hypothetical protein
MTHALGDFLRPARVHLSAAARSGGELPVPARRQASHVRNGAVEASCGRYCRRGHRNCAVPVHGLTCDNEPGQPGGEGCPRVSRLSPPKAWQARQTSPHTLAALDRLLDAYTHKEAAQQLNLDGHRCGEGKPFTARIVLELRTSNNLPSHADRLRAQGPLSISQIADDDRGGGNYLGRLAASDR